MVCRSQKTLACKGGNMKSIFRMVSAALLLFLGIDANAAIG